MRRIRTRLPTYSSVESDDLSVTLFGMGSMQAESGFQAKLYADSAHSGVFVVTKMLIGFSVR
jgi:hypothetical protein